MSINPLDGEHQPYSSNEEEVQKTHSGSIDGHSVSSQSSEDGSVGHVSSSVIGSESGAGDVNATTSQHHIDQGISEGHGEIKHVPGPEGDFYAIVTKEGEKSVDFSHIVEGVNECLDELESSSDSKTKNTGLEGIKLTLQGIGNDIKSCLDSVKGKMKESLEKTKEDLGSFGPKVKEGFKGIPGKMKESLEKTKEDLGSFGPKVKEGFKGIPGKMKESLAKTKENLSGFSENVREGFKGFSNKVKNGKFFSKTSDETGEEKEEELGVSDSFKQEGSFGFKEKVSIDSSDEAIILGDPTPERDIYPLFSQAKDSLSSFFSTSRPLFPEATMGTELKNVIEGDSSSLSSLGSVQSVEQELNELDESVKQGYGVRIKETILSFLQKVKTKLQALWNFLKKLFTRSSGDSSRVEEFDPSTEESPVAGEPESSSRKSSLPGSPRTSTEEQLMEELRTKLMLKNLT